MSSRSSLWRALVGFALVAVQEKHNKIPVLQLLEAHKPRAEIANQKGAASNYYSYIVVSWRNRGSRPPESTETS